jgi:hypothetical protein
MLNGTAADGYTTKDDDDADDDQTTTIDDDDDDHTTATTTTTTLSSSSSIAAQYISGTAYHWYAGGTFTRVNEEGGSRTTPIPDIARVRMGVVSHALLLLCRHP